MKLSQLEQAIEVARTGSLAKSALNLYISQANLSVSIKNLEEEAGAPIFNRSNRGMELTEFGQRFISYAKSVCFQMGQLEEICAQNKSLPPSVLRVGSACYSFVTSVVANVCNNHPDDSISISLSEGYVEEMTWALNKGLLDIVVTSIHSFNHHALTSSFSDLNLVFHPICTSVPGVYVSADDERFPPDLEYVEPEMLNGMIYVDYERISNLNDESKRELQVKKQSMLGIMGINSCPRHLSIDNRGAKFDIIKAVKGFSSAAYCKTAYDKTGFRSGIRFLPWKNPRYTNDVGYLIKADTPPNPLLNEFIRELKKICTE